MNNNLLLRTDGYKLSHFKQYPDGTEYVYSYIESRGGKYDKTVMFGLQYYLRKYLTKRISMADVLEAAEIAKAIGAPFNQEGWIYIINEHEGFLPLEIKAAPEGSVIETGNVLVSVINTDPKCFWLTSYVETLLLKIWYPITVATQSHKIKQVIKSYLDETAESSDGILWALNDFGYRGVSSEESAAIGDASHLVSFEGTDTIAGILMARDYYDYTMELPNTIPATEHSTMTIKGREGEEEQVDHILDQYPDGMLAMVLDGYNLWEAILKILKARKEKILGRDGTFVVRPDSGEPVHVVLKTMQLLEEVFGTTENSKGYKVLPPQVRMIQGDGINLESIADILATLKAHGYSAENIVFGMGGALLQQVDRDTQKFAMKASAAKINGEWVEVFKDPITDPGKRSKKGRLILAYNATDGRYETLQYQKEFEDMDHLQTVFKNGFLKNVQKFADIRSRADQNL